MGGQRARGGAHRGRLRILAAGARERIARVRRPYVETGWPLLPSLPLLARRFAEHLRIVHLTRHPVPSALSHLAHYSFAGSARDDAYTRWATLGPSDPRVSRRTTQRRGRGYRPWRGGWRTHAERVVDRWHHHTDAPVDPRRVLEHGATVRTATELGYGVPWLDMAALEARYQGTPDAGLDRVGRYG